MACYFDARAWIKWSSIHLTLTCSGNYTYTDNDGDDTYTGSIGGTSTLVLVRRTFDPSLFPDYAQITGPNDFVSFRQRRGCPLFLNATSLYFEGEGSEGEITITSDGPSGGDTQSGLSNLNLSLGLAESLEAEGGCDCGKPETIITSASGVALVADSRFSPFAELVEYTEEGAIPILVPWATGGTFSRSIEYDISPPIGADDPEGVCGSGVSTITVAFNA